MKRRQNLAGLHAAADEKSVQRAHAAADSTRRLVVVLIVVRQLAAHFARHRHEQRVPRPRIVVVNNLALNAHEAREAADVYRPKVGRVPSGDDTHRCLRICQTRLLGRN